MEIFIFDALWLFWSQKNDKATTKIDEWKKVEYSATFAVHADKVMKSHTYILRFLNSWQLGTIKLTFLQLVTVDHWTHSFLLWYQAANKYRNIGLTLDKNLRSFVKNFFPLSSFFKCTHVDRHTQSRISENRSFIVVMQAMIWVE